MAVPITILALQQVIAPAPRHKCRYGSMWWRNLGLSSQAADVAVFYHDPVAGLQMHIKEFQHRKTHSCRVSCILNH